MNELWSCVQPVLAAIESGLHYFLGSFDGALSTLIAIAIADYITGIFRAIAEGKLSIRIILQELTKKLVILVLVGTGNMIGIYLPDGSSAVRLTILYFFIYHEGSSLLGNAEAIGIPIPKILKDTLAKLNDRINSSQNEH